MANDVKNRLYVNSNEICLNQTRNKHLTGSSVRGQTRLFVVRPLDAIRSSYWVSGGNHYVLPQWLDALLLESSDHQNIWISVSWLQRIAQSDVGLLSWTDSPRWNWRSRLVYLLNKQIKKSEKRARIKNLIEQLIYRKLHQKGIL